MPPRELPVLFVTESDLRHDSAMGASQLVVTEAEATVFEQEKVVARFMLAELANPRVENLVDASSLVADHKGLTVELLRSTSVRALQIAGAEKRLKAVLEGKEVPVLEDEARLCPKCGRPLPEHSQVCEGCVNRGQTLLRLFSYTEPHRARVILGTVLTLGGTVLELAPPFITKHLVDDALLGRQEGVFIPLILMLIGSRILITGVQILRGRNVSYLGMRLTTDIRHSLFQKLQALSMSFYDKRNVGSIMSRMTNDTSALYDVLIDGIPVVLNQLALLIGIPIALLIMNWHIALWTLVPIPFVLVAVRSFRRRMQRTWNRVWHQWSRMSGTLNGILQGQRVVKAFHGENREVARFNRRITELSESGYVAENSWATFFPLIMFAMAMSTVVVWYVGGRGVLNRTMSYGELTAFLALVAMLQQPLMMLQRIIDWSSRALTAAERVFEVMDTPLDITDAPDALAMPTIKGGVRFLDVHFGYDKAREVLHGIDLDVAPAK